ncbi:MAG TPA: glycosyltransferase family 4 protein [Steroidobacteraceae bacterium]|nr:glycosyltransferase family 4 protein [Steroidobacteraceae bacterium]
MSSTEQVSFGTRVRRFVMRRIVRAFTLGHAFSHRLATWIGPRARVPREQGAYILLTGAFYSNNWIHSHLVPLARSARCARLRVVTTFPIEALPKLEVVAPPRWLMKIAGSTGARLLTFIGVAIRTRPDIVGGFHLLINGLLASVVGRLVGARTLYFCVGGPAEVLDGGLASENRLFERLEVPDPVVEQRLLRAVADFDWIVTMGSSARRFFEAHGVRGHCVTISGGLDASRFQPAAAPPGVDFIFVGRLVPIKRLDIYLDAIALVNAQRPVTAVVIGDGRMREECEARAAKLGIAGRVQFAGQRSDIENWLRGARVFVLTSDSEGLSLALIEAMLSGLPAVVSKVGDLPDLVENGVNGYLVDSRSPADFAARMLELVADEPRRAGFAQRAREGALRFEMSACVQLWDQVLALPAPGQGPSKGPSKDESSRMEASRCAE